MARLVAKRMKTGAAGTRTPARGGRVAPSVVSPAELRADSERVEFPPPVTYVPPPPPPALKPGWRTSCRAVNANTGRQCCLLHGHDGAHVHGRTAFTAVALSDDDVRRARTRLDEAATSRNFNPLHGASITGGGLS